MFQEQIRPLLKNPIFVLDGINNGTLAWVLISIVPFILLLLWRVWYFTIIPLIYPGNPKNHPTGFPVSRAYAIYLGIYDSNRRGRLR